RERQEIKTAPRLHIGKRGCALGEYGASVR
ncbi:hypothetical protein GCK32_017869, partial [Trichostrongylus colubriformis]